MSTPTAITETITALRDEVGQAGDLAMVAVCDRALAGDAGAITECLRVMDAAAAYVDAAAYEILAARAAAELACAYGDDAAYDAARAARAAAELACADARARRDLPVRLVRDWLRECPALRPVARGYVDPDEPTRRGEGAWVEDWAAEIRHVAGGRVRLSGESVEVCIRRAGDQVRRRLETREHHDED